MASLHLCAHIFGLETELFGDEVDGLCIESLVDGNHYSHAHERTDDLVYRHVHHVGELGNRHELGELQCLALLLLLATLLVHLLLGSLALLLTVLGSLLVLVLLCL